MAKLGGKRKGAGNKEGSIRPNFNAYWNAEEIEEYMTFLKKNYQSSPELTKYVGDHLFGKAPQGIDLTTKGEKLGSFFEKINEQRKSGDI